MSSTEANDVKNKCRRISILLISISLPLAIFSISESEVTIGDFGLISGLHPLLFVSMGLMIVSFFLAIMYNSDNTVLMLLHIALFDLILILIPLVVEGAPRFTYNYVTSSHISFIVQSGHSNHSLISYQSWPGIFYFGAILNLVCNPSVIEIIFYVPMIFTFLNLPLAYLLNSSLLENKKEIWGCFLLGLVFFWGAPIYFLPGVLGGALASYAIVMFLRWKILERRNDPAYGIVLLILAVGCVISHLLSSISLLITLLFLGSVGFIFRKERHFLTIILFIFVLIVSWQFYVVGSYSLDILRNFLDAMFRYDITISEVNRMGFSGSSQHSQVVMIRIVTALVLVVLAFIGFFKSLLKRESRIKTTSILSMIAAPSSLVLLTSYSGEILSRAFAGSASALRIFSSKNFIGKIFPCFLLCLLLIFPIFSFINAYGNEASDYVASSEIYGVSFFSSVAICNSSIHTLQPRIWGFDHQETYTRVSIDPNDFSLNMNGSNNFMLFGKRDIEDYEFLRGQVDKNEMKIVAYNNSMAKVYSSGTFNLFLMGASRK